MCSAEWFPGHGWLDPAGIHSAGPGRRGVSRFIECGRRQKRFSCFYIEAIFPSRPVCLRENTDFPPVTCLPLPPFLRPVAISFVRPSRRSSYEDHRKRIDVVRRLRDQKLDGEEERFISLCGRRAGLIRRNTYVSITWRGYPLDRTTLLVDALSQSLGKIRDSK